MLRRNLIILALMLSLGLRYWTDQRTAVDIDVTLTPIKENKNTVVYAAYSADGSVSDYVITYLKMLKEVAPNIIYVTDNPIQKREVEKLRPYVNHLMAYRHGEYDWGSYKRGYNFLTETGFIRLNHNKEETKDEPPAREPLLIFANDSTIPVVKSFKPIINQMQQKEVDFWGITANTDGMYHLQSYFLAFTPAVYQNPDLKKYLNRVVEKQTGLTVAYTYEVPFTKFLTDRGYSSAPYIPYEKLSYLPLNDKNCYPLTLLNQWHIPLLKMRTFTERLNVQEPRRQVFAWLKKNAPEAHKELIKHLRKIKSPWLKENR